MVLGWNWCIYPSSQVSGQASLITMVFSCLSSCPIFICTNRISLLNLRFRQVSNHCKRVLEATKVAYANKTKQSITSQKRDSQSFGEFPIVFSAKVNLLYLLCSTIWRCFLLHLIKQNCLLKTLLRSLILKTQVSLYLLSLRELIWNRKIFL